MGGDILTATLQQAKGWASRQQQATEITENEVDHDHYNFSSHYLSLVAIAYGKNPDRRLQVWLQKH